MRARSRRKLLSSIWISEPSLGVNKNGKHKRAGITGPFLMLRPGDLPEPWGWFYGVLVHGVGGGTSHGPSTSLVPKSAGAVTSRYSMSGE
jgi:hypothetical protein